MADGFVSLQAALARPSESLPLAAKRVPLLTADATSTVDGDGASPRDVGTGMNEAPATASSIAASLAIMWVAVAEALERAAWDAVERLARDVLGRELAQRPADIAALIAAALAAQRAESPVAIALATADLAVATALNVPIREDRSLEPGDIIVEVPGGRFESRLAFRFTANITAAATAAGIA